MATNSKAVVNGKEELIRIPLTAIHVDTDWNSRHKAWMLEAEEPAPGTTKEDAKAGQDSEGFAGFCLSIANDGQDTPAVVRPRGLGAAWEKDSKKEYALVVGFRRYEAIKRVAESGGSIHVDKKEPTILAIVRPLTEEQAQALNMRENVDRENLSPADIAWGVWRLHTSAKMTQQAIATDLGVSQGRVSKLLIIMKNLDVKVAKHWREAGANSLTVEQMRRVSDLPGNEQAEAYKGMAGGESKATKATAWQKNAASKATSVGTLLGSLCKAECLDSETTRDALTEPASVECYIKPPKDKKISDKLRDTCMTAALEAFDRAVAVDEAPEESDETPAPKAKKGGKEKAASAPNAS